MDYYGFAVTGFQITQTRAYEDTLWLSHAIYADGDQIAYSNQQLGGELGLEGVFNNGSYQTRDLVPAGTLGLEAVINDPQVNVSFIFQLVNAGNAPAGTLTGRLSSTFDALSGIAAGLQGAGVAVTLGGAAIPIALTLEAFANLYAWLTVDCDGPVAVDQISGPRYLIDAWADDTNGDIYIDRQYPGTATPSGYCNEVPSEYQVQWNVQHYRRWDAEIIDSAQAHQLHSATGVSAATHNGAVHVFGVMPGPAVTHGRTYTGGNWYVDSVALTNPSDLPVSAVSFNDRLYIFGTRADGSIWPQAYTTDGGSWVDPTAQVTQPAGLQTNKPIATAVFRNRLYVFARSAADNSLQVISTSDLIFWTAWAVVPATGLAPSTPVAAAALGDRLYIFGVHESREAPAQVVVSNATSNGTTWTGWQMVEANARPEGQPNSDEPLDVAATTFGDRVYIASRWKPADPNGTAYIAVNFSADGDNWAGWREPPLIPNPTTAEIFTPQPSATAGLAGAGNHLYILTAAYSGNDSTMVAVY